MLDRLKSTCTEHKNYNVMHEKLECPVCEAEKEKQSLLFDESDLIKATNEGKIEIINLLTFSFLDGETITLSKENVGKIFNTLTEQIEKEL